MEQCNIAAEEVVAVESVGEGRIEEKGVGVASVLRIREDSLNSSFNSCRMYIVTVATMI